MPTDFLCLFGLLLFSNPSPEFQKRVCGGQKSQHRHADVNQHRIHRRNGGKLCQKPFQERNRTQRKREIQERNRHRNQIPRPPTFDDPVFLVPVSEKEENRNDEERPRIDRRQSRVGYKSNATARPNFPPFPVHKRRNQETKCPQQKRHIRQNRQKSFGKMRKATDSRHHTARTDRRKAENVLQNPPKANRSSEEESRNNQKNQRVKRTTEKFLVAFVRQQNPRKNNGIQLDGKGKRQGN